jgi:hypothetical protein
MRPSPGLTICVRLAAPAGSCWRPTTTSLTTTLRWTGASWRT